VCVCVCMVNKLPYCRWIQSLLLLLFLMGKWCRVGEREKRISIGPICFIAFLRGISVLSVGFGTSTTCLIPVCAIHLQSFRTRADSWTVLICLESSSSSVYECDFPHRFEMASSTDVQDSSLYNKIVINKKVCYISDLFCLAHTHLNSWACTHKSFSRLSLF
jgi:hypothetical protein